MKFITYEKNKTPYPGITDEETIWDISTAYPSIMAVLETNGLDYSSIQIKHERGEFPIVGMLEEVTLLPPLVYPRKLLCVAGNYMDHIREGGRQSLPRDEQAPWFFCVPPSNVMIGNHAIIPLHPRAKQIDYEGELGVVIGKRAKFISADEAKEVIAGYTIYNDISERSPFMLEGIEHPRDLSFWYKKSFDGYGPTGPYLVTHDEISDPQDLLIEVYVNDERRQHCSTDQMIFSVYELVSFLSGFLTLEPGDILATGTPAGVGYGTGKFLQPGDCVQIRIDGLGVLENRLSEMPENDKDYF